MVKFANAEWHGNLKDGNGKVSTESGNLDSSYGFNARFAGEKGTNPEELLGAAHASCFSMALANNLSTKGFKPEYVKTEDKVYLEKVGDNFRITKIEVNMEASVPEIDDATFQAMAEDAKQNCPISYALRSTEITLIAKLNK
ncbi:MAG: OsmC family protein [Candidatus Sericytochromatia bacterium]|nr:OsmC family protein [Candidatus Sericytochromatia bacterium]